MVRSDITKGVGLARLLFFILRHLHRSNSSQKGMSVTELMVGICIVGILSAAAVPYYTSYVQQARVVALVIPRLHMIEFGVSLFYSTSGTLPSRSDVDEVIAPYDTDNLSIDLISGTIVLTVDASEPSSKLHILDGKVLIASPVVSKARITSWHLDGELADRLKINY